MLIGKGYQRGTAIRLISCRTGAYADGAAYELSRYLKAPVTAPTNLVGDNPNGSYFILDNGRFKTFQCNNYKTLI